MRTINAHDSQVRDIALAPDGLRLASCGLDMSIKLWDTTTGEILGTLDVYPDDHNSFIGVADIAFSPDGQTLVSGTRHSAVRIWDAEIFQERATLDGHVDGSSFVVFSPDGTTLVCGGGDGKIKLWRTCP